MLPPEQIKQFLVRLVTGYGQPVQPDGGDEKSLLDTTTKMINMAGKINFLKRLHFESNFLNILLIIVFSLLLAVGLASLTFKKKELFQRLVADALDSEGAYTDTDEPSEGLKTALAFIGNAAKDIMVWKYHYIFYLSIFMFNSDIFYESRIQNSGRFQRPARHIARRFSPLQEQ